MNLFGESFLFVALAVLVFLCASLVEGLCIIDRLLKSRVTQKAIDYLTKNKTKVILNRQDVKKDLWEWMQEHITGRVVSDDNYKLNIQNNRFVLSRLATVEYQQYAVCNHFLLILQFNPRDTCHLATP